MRRALCAYHPRPDIFHAEKGKSGDRLEAMKVCMKCPVRAECDDYRQRVDSDFGIWAGKLQTRNGKDKE